MGSNSFWELKMIHYHLLPKENNSLVSNQLLSDPNQHDTCFLCRTKIQTLVLFGPEILFIYFVIKHLPIYFTIMCVLLL